MADDKNFSSSPEVNDNEESNENLDGLDNEIEDDKNVTSTNELEEENLKLKNEIEDLKNKVLRVSAEYDNYRKRTVREKNELYGNACLDVIVQILPILDNLERASLAESDFDSFKKGIDMVINLFRDVLQKLDVKEIDSTGTFDPNFHEAVAHISDDNFGKNTIVEVLQKGYVRNEKVLRHSMVKVAN